MLGVKGVACGFIGVVCTFPDEPAVAVGSVPSAFVALYVCVCEGVCGCVCMRGWGWAMDHTGTQNVTAHMGWCDGTKIRSRQTQLRTRSQCARRMLAKPSTRGMHRLPSVVMNACVRPTGYPRGRPECAMCRTPHGSHVAVHARFWERLKRTSTHRLRSLARSLGCIDP